MEEGRIAFKILTGKPTGKRPLGRPRCRWEDNVIYIYIYIYIYVCVCVCVCIVYQL